MNIQQALDTAFEKISISPLARQQHMDKAALRFDVELLLAHVFQHNRSWIKTWPEKDVPEDILNDFFSSIEKRAQGFPIAYIRGEQDFWSLSFHVNPDVLIPRPETECLVEFLLSQYSKNHLKGLELGTGSGALVLAIAHERPKWQLDAIDISEAALCVAKKNAERLAILNVNFYQSDWFSSVKSTDFDFIISNPPYVEDNAIELRQESIQFEPELALCAGTDGLNAIRRISQNALHFLKANGLLIIEHGFQQADAVQLLFKKHGFISIKSHADYSGKQRFTSGQKP